MKEVPKTYTEVHLDFLNQQLNEMQAKLDRCHLDKFNLEYRLAEVSEQLNIMIGESYGEVFPQMSDFCL